MKKKNIEEERCKYTQVDMGAGIIKGSYYKNLKQLTKIGSLPGEINSEAHVLISMVQ